jgi:hypothetical protein
VPAARARNITKIRGIYREAITADAWRDPQANADSVPAKLNARFAARSNNVSRSGFDTY